MSRRSQSYAGYLELERLLSLQHPLSDPPEHDELLFILVHQIYELWFKALLHELDALRAGLEAGDHTQSFRSLRRLCTVLKTMVQQVDVLETMSPTRFHSFRARLEASSGVESAQFREVEFVCGYKQSGLVGRVASDADRARLERRLDEPTVYDAFLHFLSARRHPVPEALLARDIRQTVQPSKALQETLVQVYRHDPGAAQICELLVDYDEGFQEWRYRHVKMVERTIGDRTGTGGSTGASYLRSTLFQPFFPDLWAVRDRL